MAFRSGSSPQVTAYWLLSAAIAAQAASLIAWGAWKSGSPWDRFTLPYVWLSRVISRITDSVKSEAFFDPVKFAMACDLDAPKQSTAFAGFCAGPRPCSFELERATVWRPFSRELPHS